MRSRFLTPSLLATAMALAFGAPHPAACGDGADPIAFDTVAVLSDTTGINLVPHVAIPVRTADDRADLGRLLDAGTIGGFADRVLAAVDEVPAGRMPLVGIIDTSCSPPTTPGLRRDDGGNVTMYAVDPVQNQVECFVAVDTVAVLAVDPADVPVGAADSADLVAFERVIPAPTGSPTAAELAPGDGGAVLATMLGPDHDVPTLPPSAKGMRRFAFVRPGCEETTAELLVTRRDVEARLYHEPLDEVIDCVRAEYFLAVFDVVADLVWPNATVGT